MSQPQLTVFETTGFPNPARIRAALSEKEALDHVLFIEIDVMNLEHRTQDFYAINPSGTVPVLKTAEGTFLSECTAITEYINLYFSGTDLTGKTALDRGDIHMMQRRAESMIMDAVSAYFHHGTEGLGPALEVNQCEPWGIRQKEVALQGLMYFDQHLEHRAFVAADRFSMADITLFYSLVFVDFAKVPIDESLTHLLTWREKMIQRPCFQ